jgi:hypothetical protein
MEGAMATVSFECDHCRRLLSVGSECLSGAGEVRCPHCGRAVENMSLLRQVVALAVGQLAAPPDPGEPE